MSSLRKLAIPLANRYNLPHAPLAQLVRAFDSHSKGRRFESYKVHTELRRNSAHIAGRSIPVVRTIRVRVDRVRFPAARHIVKLRFDI